MYLVTFQSIFTMKGDFFYTKKSKNNTLKLEQYCINEFEISNPEEIKTFKLQHVFYIKEKTSTLNCRCF